MQQPRICEAKTERVCSPQTSSPSQSPTVTALPKGEPLAWRYTSRFKCKASGFARGSPFGRAGALAPERASTLPRSAALSQKAALHLPFPFTTPPVKIAFGAARRPRQTRNKNNLSAIYAQSNAEHILNRPTSRGSAFPQTHDRPVQGSKLHRAVMCKKEDRSLLCRMHRRVARIKESI